MRKLFDENFFLGSETAKELYHGYAKDMPIIDYHCHVSPYEIADDKQYGNITEVWLGGDHYKWRLMRWCGVDERYITGDAPDYEKFLAFASALPRAPGNPVYHWTHLELQRYFGCELALGPDTAEEIWNICNEKLKNGLTVREIIRRSNVDYLCTTDDPADDLAAHKRIFADDNIKTGVYPTFRPDKAFAVGKPGYPEYINRLSDAFGTQILSYDSLLDALASRLDYFADCGCLLSDHGLDSVTWSYEPADCESLFKRAVGGEILSAQESEAFQASMMLFLGKQYAKRGIIMQIHYAALRSVNPRMYKNIGPDTGFDSIDTPNCSRQLAAYLGALENDGMLPKTILYSLNPNDNSMLSCISGSFQETGIAGKVQHGSAWWFNDAKLGIRSQLTTLAEIGVLGGFIGMLTDSRSFLSYTRHEYFRRILCDLLGDWIEKGEFSSDMKLAGGIAADVSYNNAKRYLTRTSRYK